MKSPFRKLFDTVTLQSVLSDLSHAVAPERLGPSISKHVCWRANTHLPRIALTFDDGPHPEYTPKLLSTLGRNNVLATFFLIGKHLQKQPDLGREIVASGHEIANHTFSHPLLFRLPDQEMKDEIHRTDLLLRNLGANPRFLRPPMGLFSPRVLRIVEESGYRTVVGDVYPRDPHLPGKEKIVKRTLMRVTKGSIIILHDGGNGARVDRSQTIWAVEKLIPKLQHRGFEFVTLSELLV